MKSIIHTAGRRCRHVLVGVRIDFPTDQIIFEVISAFGTVGLSTGITAQLPVSGQQCAN